jgi:hypothetical protein
MIDYERAEAQAALLLRTLRSDRGQQTRRQCALRLAFLIAALEFVVILAFAVERL